MKLDNLKTPEPDVGLKPNIHMALCRCMIFSVQRCRFGRQALNDRPRFLTAVCMTAQRIFNSRCISIARRAILTARCIYDSTVRFKQPVRF